MKLNLKLMTLATLIGLNSGCFASTGLSFFNALDNRWQSSIVPKPEVKTPAKPLVFAPVPVSTPVLMATPVSGPATSPAATIPTTSATSAQTVQPAISTVTVTQKELFAGIKNTHTTTKVDATQVGKKAASGNGGLKKLWESTKNGFNDFVTWANNYIPSQETLLKGAFASIAGSNAWKRYCQTKTAYNNGNINECFKSCLLTAVSAAGTLMASERCREKTGSLLSTVIIGATALDIIQQTMSRSRTSKISFDTLIKQGDENKDIKCADCEGIILTASNIDLTKSNQDLLGSTSSNISFKSGDNITYTGKDDTVRVYCEKCSRS